MKTVVLVDPDADAGEKLYVDIAAWRAACLLLAAYEGNVGRVTDLLRDVAAVNAPLVDEIRCFYMEDGDARDCKEGGGVGRSDSDPRRVKSAG